MKLIGLVSWWRESPTWIAATLASLHKAGVDHVVAVDGAYALMVEATPYSGPLEQQAFVELCKALGMGCTLHVPSEPWYGNECEKRTFLFRVGNLVAEPGTDWLWVMDADQVVEQSPPDLKARLEQTDLDVAATWFTERTDTLLPETAKQARSFDWDPTSRFTVRNIFRAQPITVGPNHYTYVADNGDVLWGEKDRSPVECLVLADVVIDHRTQVRDLHRREMQRQFYKARDELGIERRGCQWPDCEDKAAHTVGWHWERIEGSDSLSGLWIEVCDAHHDKARVMSDTRVRTLTSGKYGLDDMKVTTGKVPV
jgi:hypothetical protein